MARVPIVLLSGCLLASSAASAIAQPRSGAPKMRIAVMDLSGKAYEFTSTYSPRSTRTTVELPPPDGFARGLTEMLTTALIETGRFVVLERAELQSVLQEQDFGASGRVNPETAPRLGNVIGAQTLVTGEITEFTYQQSSVGGDLRILSGLDAAVDRVEAMVALDIRVIDAVTGEVVFSTRSEGDASATGAAVDLSVAGQEFGTSSSWTTPLGEASREAIEDAVEDLVEELMDLPWQGRIVDVRGETIYVNAGADLGIRRGMEFDVYEESEALVDPSTGQVLGAPEQRIGRVRITAVEARYSTARAVEGAGFRRDHVIKARGRGARP